MYMLFLYTLFRHEVDVLAIKSYLKGINLASFVFTERTTLFITIVAYVLQGHTVSADKVFTMAQYFNILQLTMAILFPIAVGSAAEAGVSIRRIEVAFSTVRNNVTVDVHSFNTIFFRNFYSLKNTRTIINH